MTVADLLGRVSSSELTEWAAYWELEPFGPQIESWRAAQIAAILANVNRKKGTKALKTEDFMPRFERRAGADEMAAPFRALAARGKRG